MLFKTHPTEEEKAAAKAAHAEKERKFLAAMGGVRADAGENRNTDVSATDPLAKQLEENVKFEDMPSAPPKDETPEVKPPPVQHDPLMDQDLHEKKNNTEAVHYDEKTKRFYQIFNGVPETVAVDKYGQAEPNASANLSDMPDHPPVDKMGEVPVEHRPDPKLADDNMDEEGRVRATRKKDTPHDKYVSLYDCKTETA